MDVLTPRQKLILAAIVEDYIRSAEPVGSRTLSKHQDFQLSPATIRNEMADLEELGYLDQPHTSAGRVPSQKGYRYYVDHLATRREMDPQTLRVLRDLFRQRMDEVERVIQQTATVLSQLTQYAAIALGPLIHQQHIRHIQLVPLGGNAAVAILVTDTGHVENRHVTLPDDIPPGEMVRLVNLLNAKLVGTPLARLRSHLYQEIAAEMVETLERYEDAISVLDQLSETLVNGPGQVVVGGVTNMLGQPEFRDVERVRPVLELLESADWRRALDLVPLTGPGVQVRIGMENPVASLQDCTVVSATYTVGGVPVGSIGVIGPTRMNYARVMRILEYTAGALTRLMTERLTGS